MQLVNKENPKCEMHPGQRAQQELLEGSIFFLLVLFPEEQTENYVMKMQNWRKSKVKRNRRQSVPRWDLRHVNISDHHDENDNHDS